MLWQFQLSLDSTHFFVKEKKKTRKNSETNRANRVKVIIFQNKQTAGEIFFNQGVLFCLHNLHAIELIGVMLYLCVHFHWRNKKIIMSYPLSMFFPHFISVIYICIIRKQSLIYWELRDREREREWEKAELSAIGLFYWYIFYDIYYCNN